MTVFSHFTACDSRNRTDRIKQAGGVWNENCVNVCETYFLDMGKTDCKNVIFNIDIGYKVFKN